MSSTQGLGDSKPEEVGAGAPEVGAINSAIRRLGVAHRAKTADLLMRHGVRIGQELLLLELAERKVSTQAALAESAGTEASTITVALRKLEAAGLVERSRSTRDARAQVVRLTPDGDALIGDIQQVQQDLADRIVAGLQGQLTAEEFIAVVNRVSEQIGQ